MNVVSKEKISNKVTSGSAEEIPPTTHHGPLSKSKSVHRRYRDPPILKRRNEKDFIHPPMPVRKRKFPFTQFKYRPPKGIPSKSVQRPNASYVKLTKSFFGNESLGSIQSNLLKTQQKCAALDQTCEEFVPLVTSTPILSASKNADNVKCLGSGNKAENKESEDKNLDFHLQDNYKEDDLAAATRMSKYLADCQANLQHRREESAHENDLSIGTPPYFQVNNAPKHGQYEISFFNEQNLNLNDKNHSNFSNKVDFLDLILECEESNEPKSCNLSLNENRFSIHQMHQRTHRSHGDFQLGSSSILDSVQSDFLNMTEPISSFFPGVSVRKTRTLEYTENRPDLDNSTFNYIFGATDQRFEPSSPSKVLEDLLYEEYRRKSSAELPEFPRKTPKRPGGASPSSELRCMDGQNNTYELFRTPTRNYDSNNRFQNSPLSYLNKNIKPPQKWMSPDLPGCPNYKNSMKHLQEEPSMIQSYCRTRRHSNSSEFDLPPVDVKWEPYFPAQFSTPTRPVNDTFEADHQELAYKTERILESIEKDLTESPTFRYSPRKMF